MTPDPLHPSTATLPLSSSGGLCYPLPHTPGPLRPFAATLAVPPPPVAKKHDTASTRNATTEQTQQSEDGQVRSDSIADTTVDS
jgi:hypothetical protein